MKPGALSPHKACGHPSPSLTLHSPFSPWAKPTFRADARPDPLHSPHPVRSGVSILHLGYWANLPAGPPLPPSSQQPGGSYYKTQPGKAPCGSCPFRVNPEPPPWSVKSSACGPSALHTWSLLSPCASNLTPTSPDSAPATRASGSGYKALALPPDIWSLSNRGGLGLVFLSQIHYQG